MTPRKLSIKKLDVKNYYFILMLYGALSVMSNPYTSNCYTDPRSEGSGELVVVCNVNLTLTAILGPFIGPFSQLVLRYSLHLWCIAYCYARSVRYDSAAPSKKFLFYPLALVGCNMTTRADESGKLTLILFTSGWNDISVYIGGRHLDRTIKFSSAD